MPPISRLVTKLAVFAREGFGDGTRTIVQVFKFLIPTVLIVEGLGFIGALELLEQGLTPLMTVLGLPSAFGIVWASALLTNLYSGIAVLALMLPESGASAADVSVLCTMMLIAHALPVEGAITHMIGLKFWWWVVLRVGAALGFGLVASPLCAALDWLQHPAPSFAFSVPEAHNPGQWLYNQMIQWLSIALIIYALIYLNLLLKRLGIERVLLTTLAPFLKGLGIRRGAAGMALVGSVLGITYGSALMLNEARLGHIRRKDMILTIIFLSLVHAVIEDTLLMMLAGGHLSLILFGRLVYGWVLTLIFWLVYDILERRGWLAWFVHSPIQNKA